MAYLPCVEGFNPVGESVTPRWMRWKKSFELYIAARGDVKAEQKKPLLLHCAGQEVQAIFETLQGGESYEDALTALDSYFKPQVNETFERHQFRQVSQKEESSVSFITKLRQKAVNCNFGDKLDDNIRDQFIDKCKDRRLRMKLLEQKELTLAKLITIAQAHEAAQVQVKEMEQGKERTQDLAGAVSGKSGHRPWKDTKNKSTAATNTRKNEERKKEQQKKNKCFRCGKDGHFARDPTCPAKGKTCSKCGKKNHFATVCKTKQENLNNVREYDDRLDDVVFDDDDDVVFVVKHAQANIHAVIGGIELPMLIDSGASCNIIDVQTYNTMKAQNMKHTIQEKKPRKLFAYGQNKPLTVVNTFLADVHIQGVKEGCREEFVVIAEKGAVPLLGKTTAEKMGVLRIGVPGFVGSVSEKPENKFPKLFSGLGKLKDTQIHLHQKENVKPVVQKARKIPFSLREKVEEKIHELEELDIIERACGPTSFVSPIVVVPKPNGEIRLCVDMRQANEAIERERFPIPTVEETLTEMNGSKVFTKLDLKWGFHQLELSEASRPITTFATHIGMFRYKRLMFGVTSAPEIYQFTIQNVLRDCPGQRNLSDDIIVFAETVEEHDKRLEKVLKTLEESGLTLNASKCVYRMNEIQFMGFLLSEKGIGPTQAKVEAVKNAQKPQNAAEIRSFLGLVNFNGRFICDLSTKSEPLARLTRKGVPFKWTEEQDRAFNQLKQDLANAETLGYFDPKAEETRIIADASPVGLGAVLVQTQKGTKRAIYYASRSLTDTEKRYSQTEKEALALVWACERFHQYVYGIEFILETDHRPLQVIYGKRSKPSARIERWVLRLQSYHFTVEYKPGHQNLADSLSRLLPKVQSEKKTRNVAEEYICFIANSAVPNKMKLEEVEIESEKDTELSALRQAIKDNNFSSCSNSFKMLRNELAVVGDLVVRGTRLVIPASLRNRVIDLGHEGHQGIVKTKERLRTKVWWPGIDKDVEKRVRSCHQCQIVGERSVPEPMTRTKFPEGPWEDLAVDILGPLPTGESILVCVDYYSRYYEVKVMKSTNSTKVIEALDNFFTTHGLPKSVRTDNGPQFVSAEFENFLKTNGIEHRHTTPLWPQANGEVERQNRTLLKNIKIAHSEKKNWRQELNTFLIAYRTTPHCTTGVSPAELMFKRQLRTKLPDFEASEIREFRDETVRDRDLIRKEIGKQYADSQRRSTHSEVQIGSEVLLQKKKTDKLTPTFEPEPFKVIDKSNTEVTIQSPAGVTYRRNIAHTKPYYRREQSPQTGETHTNEKEDKQTHVPQILPSDENERRETEVRKSERVRKIPEKFKDFVLTEKT